MNIYYEDECYETKSKVEAKEIIGNICFNNLIDDYDCAVRKVGNAIFIEAKVRV